jgi:hypothetical protein
MTEADKQLQAECMLMGTYFEAREEYGVDIAQEAFLATLTDVLESQDQANFSILEDGPLY